MGIFRGPRGNRRFVAKSGVYAKMADTVFSLIGLQSSKTQRGNGHFPSAPHQSTIRQKLSGVPLTGGNRLLANRTQGHRNPAGKWPSVRDTAKTAGLSGNLAVYYRLERIGFSPSVLRPPKTMIAQNCHLPGRPQQSPICEKSARQCPRPIISRAGSCLWGLTATADLLRTSSVFSSTAHIAFSQIGPQYPEAHNCPQMIIRMDE